MSNVALEVLCVALLIVAVWLLVGGGRGALFYRQATASKVRCVVFATLLIWAMYDAVMTLRDWGPLPLFVRACGFFMSLLLSLFFIGLIALAWDWLVRRFRRT